MRRIFLLSLLVAAVAGYAVPSHAQTPSPDIRHDGNWLRTEFPIYERVTSPDQHTEVNFDEAIRGTALAGYIGGVLATLRENILRARIQEIVIREGKQQALKGIDYAGMRKGDNLFSPLWNTGFYDATLSMDQIVAMVKNYVERHPEKWGLSAATLIENALIDVFPHTDS